MLLQLMHIINLFTLLFSTTGVLVHQHYCQDKLKTLSFYTQSMEDCCKKHKEHLAKPCDSSSPQINKKPCCENKTILNIDDSIQQLSVINDGLVSVWNICFTPFAPSLIAPTMEQLFLLDKNKQLRYYSYKAPPNKTPLHLLLCSFRC
ncbi:MAG: hypothetical protein JKY03_08330 [Aureispira sp.]|nr:hypothetical protein [Aureispira sp.]